ncbi:probable prolyl 4-hydroxylase 3 isoform X2 [Nymphaea colorata]|uniref:probable prolyl 4-hydroxylase 3 isoform X2 n=1 Tax=Nymphaea colorata TaxID=210225 RepID=UPI00214EBBEE|nr:probable prolyl 4-hydroxylase 3 isoform X2 [Nymphaea colorata]
MVKAGRRSRKAGGRSTSSLIICMLFMLSLIFLFLVAVGIIPLPISEHEDEGSNGEDELISIYEGNGTMSMNKNIDMAENHRSWSEGVDGQKKWMEILSWQPRAFLYNNFLSRDECEHLINLAKPNLRRSSVVDSRTGKSIPSRVRTSSGAFLKRGQDDIISRIEKRIADVSFVPVENGEGLQVLRYIVGEKYDPHFDFFHDSINTMQGGQRLATMLMYLSDVKEGGETVFPRAAVNISTASARWNNRSKCAKTGMALRPRMGDALLFWSMHPDASLDALSLHGGCPVIKGDKWSATKWMRVGPFTG